MLGNLFENVDSNLSPKNAKSKQNSVNRKPSKDGKGRSMAHNKASELTQNNDKEGLQGNNGKM